MAMNLDALLRITAKVAGRQEIERLGNSMQGVTGKVKNLQMGFAALGGTIVVADAARRYFQGFNEAEKAAAAVRTLGVDSKILEGQLLSVSNRLGGLYSQTQLLTAAYDVASAGFANAADNAKVLEAAAKGATGGLSDINTVGNAVTSVLNAYGKSAADAAMLVDGFIQTQNDGKIVLDQYAKQIGNLAPSAAAAGVGIQEINAAIATITAQGVPVEATFTGLNQALVSILKPSKEASDLAASLGIEFNEAGLRAKGFGGLLQDVKDKTGGSTTALVKLFGSVEALKALLPLLSDDLEKYNANLDKQAKASGVAEDATRELGGTVSSEITKMVNQIGNLTRSLDTVLGPALGGIVRLINVVIAEATRGINVLGQLFSLNKNTTILKQSLESGDLRGAAAGRVIPGVDELIGETRRKELQRQAGAGTGLFGLGFDAQKFAELLKQQPEIKKLLGGQTPAGASRPVTELDAALKALIEKGTTGAAKPDAAAGKAANAAQKAADAAQKERERVAGVISARMAEAEIMKLKSEQQDRIAAAEQAGDQMLAARLRGQERELDLQYRYAQELARENDLEAQKAIIYEGQVALVANQRATERELNRLAFESQQRMLEGLGIQAEKQREVKTAMEQQAEAADGIANTLGQGLASAFDGLITGAENWGESLRRIAAGALQDIARQLIRIYVIEQAISAIKTFLSPVSGGALANAGSNLTGTGALATSIPGLAVGARANGGPVMGGSPYLVGERGPELFVPGRTGMIVPNNQISSGTNVTVNVDASGSSVQGNDQQAGQLGRAIAAAVQQELIKQKRPGGLLTA